MSLSCPEQGSAGAPSPQAEPKIHQILLQRSPVGTGTMITAPGVHPGGEELSLKLIILPSPFSLPQKSCFEGGDLFFKEIKVH